MARGKREGMGDGPDSQKAQDGDRVGWTLSMWRSTGAEIGRRGVGGWQSGHQEVGTRGVDLG